MEASGVLIRRLEPADIPQAMRLKEAAGWNQTERDWLNLIELEPEGCFALEVDGVVASTTTVVCYGRELAWIGMVLTAPEYRGRGFARRLMERAIQYARGKGVAWIKLDATDMGYALYRSLGFVDEGLVERWALETRAEPPRAPEVFPFALDEALDREAFGADRRAVLMRLACWEAASLPDCGYALGRPGSKAFYFGPCVCRTPETAHRLLEYLLARQPTGTIFWDLLDSNRAAVELARHYGFQPRRRLVRMRLRCAEHAPPLTHRDELVYALAGFEYG